MRPQRRKAFLLSSFLLCLPSRLFSQTDDAALLARVQQAALKSALDTPTAQPFHLKLGIHLDPQHGRPAEDGTVELWWSSLKSHRTVYDLPSYKATFLETPDGHFQTVGAKAPPYLVHYMVDHILHPMPLSISAESFKSFLSKHSFGKVTLDCVALTEIPKKPVPFVPLPVTYCLDRDSNNLRLTADHAGQDSIRNILGNFRGVSVPMNLDFTFTGHPVAHAHIEKLAGQADSYAETSDTSGLNRISAPTHIAGSIQAGSIIEKIPPVYPYSAKMNRISGAVLLHAIIGVDGKIKDLEVIGSPDESLTTSAMDAVQRWTYKPYLLNGTPTEVDTTITVNFNFAPAHL